MKIQYFLSMLFFASAASVNAEWFLRGTHNDWTATPMVSSSSTTMRELSSVVFVTAGSVKFDRYGDWIENYGVGGMSGTNIPVEAGTWDIKFYTDTKKWTIAPVANVHIRGTFNNWAEGTLLTRVATTDIYQRCINFSQTAGDSRFKIDPQGGWGGDEIPNADFLVAPGWALVSFNIATKIISVRENAGVNCSNGSSASSKSSGLSSSYSSVLSSTRTSSSISAMSFHLRGTHNSWAEGDFFSAVPGSATNYETCRNFSIGGGAAFKIDPNGGWGADAFPSENHPASGWTKIIINSRSLISVTTNLGINCASSSSSSISSARENSSSSKSSAANSSAASFDDFRARTIYFMFVDRFANGNPGNDWGFNSDSTSTVKSAGGQSEWKKYWGGDIAGVISKLDYLQSLGVTAIWMTPLVGNINVGSEGGYHGYWANDFYDVDEHLGDWALVDELDAQMEARGMKLILDLALNHSNQSFDYEFGRLLKEGAFVTDFANGRNTWYHDNGSIADCDDQDPSTTCSREWGDPIKYRNKSLHNLADFNQGTDSNTLADTYLINAALKWMDHGVDAFRIDAIKHIEPNFTNRFSAAIRAKKADAYIFGEWYGAGAGEATSMAFLNARRGSELLDFKLRDNIENAIAGNSTMITLNTHILSRPGAMKNNEDLQAIFLDNHDATRTSVYLQTTGRTSRGTGKGLTKAFAEARQNMGMALVMTLPGIPTIYYGTEQNSAWFTANNAGAIGHDPYNREQMPSFNTTTPAFKLISSLANLRKTSPAIQRGNYISKLATNDILIFQRQEGGDCVVVAVNRGAPTNVDVPDLCLVDGAYTNKLGSDIVNVAGSSANFNLSQNEVIVLR